MHARVPEINVHQIRVPPPEKLHQLRHFPPVMQRRNPLDEFQIEARPKRLVRLGQQFDVVEGKTLRALSLFGHNKRLILLKGADLPVDV